jgi:hypothetical protein
MFMVLNAALAFGKYIDNWHGEGEDPHLRMSQLLTPLAITSDAYEN